MRKLAYLWTDGDQKPHAYAFCRYLWLVVRFIFAEDNFRRVYGYKRTADTWRDILSARRKPVRTSRSMTASGLGGAASGRQVMDLVWIWHVEVSLRLPEVTMAPGKPALAPALPCLAVCATWSNTLSLYASLVFDPQVNDPDLSLIHI